MCAGSASMYGDVRYDITAGIMTRPSGIHNEIVIHWWRTLGAAEIEIQSREIDNKRREYVKSVAAVGEDDVFIRTLQHECPVPLGVSANTKPAWYRVTGWPAYALKCEMVERNHAKRGQAIVFDDGSRKRLLPLVPIIPGFLASTTVYGVLWLATLVGMRTMQRTFRTRQGKCKQCGYQLRGIESSNCPECGDPR